MNTTRCAVWIRDDGFRIEEQPLTGPGPGEVQVQVDSCGVCMTDVHYTDGILVETAPRIILGHEWSGRIEALGPGVTGLDVGAPVAGIGQGGYSEHVVVSVERVFPIPADIPLERAAFVEPKLSTIAYSPLISVDVTVRASAESASPSGVHSIWT
jgi:D-arabinose 1-dehydrogenase-like Zn-dependent alcohol dehydrogenase